MVRLPEQALPKQSYGVTTILLSTIVPAALDCFGVPPRNYYLRWGFNVLLITFDDASRCDLPGVHSRCEVLKNRLDSPNPALPKQS